MPSSTRPQIRVAECGCVLVLHHPDTATLAQAEGEIAAYFRMAERTGPGALLILADKPFPPAPRDVRDRYRRSLEEGPGVQAVAIVTASRFSLGASLVNSLATYVFSIGRGSTQFRLFDDEGAASRWLCEVVDTGVQPFRLERAAAALRHS